MMNFIKSSVSMAEASTFKLLELEGLMPTSFGYPNSRRYFLFTDSINLLGDLLLGDDLLSSLKSFEDWSNCLKIFLD